MRRRQSSEMLAAAAAAARFASPFPGALSSAFVASVHARHMSPFASRSWLTRASFSGPAHPTTSNIASAAAGQAFLVMT
jgi:hypothetical protein